MLKTMNLEGLVSLQITSSLLDHITGSHFLDTGGCYAFDLYCLYFSLQTVYAHFCCHTDGLRDVNNVSGADLSTKEDGKGENKESDERENDEQLLWIADILKRLHQRFYSQSLSEIELNQRTVPGILCTMRREILGHNFQANIVFSGVVPIQQQKVQTTVRLPLVRYAEELGAKICPTVTKAVTHVVAKRDHSDKIKKARAEIPGCYIVYPSWLMECYWSITRREVEPHIMGPMPIKSQQQDKTNDSILFAGDDDEESKLEDEDEEDDDFLNEMLG